MAYGNWGAFVYKNEVRQKNREDNTPYQEDELEAGYWQAFSGVDENGNRTLTGAKLHCVHASLGSGKVRLCAYKNYPELYLEGKEVEIKDNTDEYSEDDDEIHAKGEIEGYKFTIRRYDGNMIDLELIDPDGTKWTCTAGLCYGAGYTDEDEE